MTCVSEAEKYEKSLYKPKKEKINPQDAWMQQIEKATSDESSAPANIRPHLNRLAELSNVPRNKKKFINFAKNSLRLSNDSILEAIWTHLEQFRVTPATQESGKDSSRNTATHQIGDSESTSCHDNRSESQQKDDPQCIGQKSQAKNKRKQEELDATIASSAGTVLAQRREEEEKNKKHKKKHKKSKDDIKEEEKEISASTCNTVSRENIDLDLEKERKKLAKLERRKERKEKKKKVEQQRS